MFDIDWLLSENDWIAYRTRLDLLHEALDEKTDASIKKEILSQPPFHALTADLEAWPGEALKRHNDSGHLIHKLAFLADAGINHTDGNLRQITDKIRSFKSEEGIFQVLMNIPVHYGGTGQDGLIWMLCDAPTILYALAKMGLSGEEDVLKATGYLVSLQDENGFRCRVSGELGKFRGPGRKDDPCPYANLIMLKLISQFDTHEFDEAVRRSADSLLNLWHFRKERKEYLFGMGTDFEKPKAPLVWLDILNVLDVLSNYPQIHSNPSFKEMLGELQNMLDENGRLTAQSMYRPWKDWEFSNKKEPSRWLTFLAYRIFDRVG